MTIYIKDPYVSKYVTEEKITEIAFVGTVGGVLGLFMGFSFISAVEIIYVFCVKFIQVKCKGWLIFFSPNLSSLSPLSCTKHC